MIKTIRHSGIVVTDMDKALVFYRDLLGFRSVLDVTREGEFFDRLLAHQGIKMRLVMLAAPDGNRIELFQFYSHSKKALQPGEITDIGCSHLCFSVEDVDKAYKVLSEHGIRFNCPPLVSPDGYGKVTYCHDPDGATIELVQILDTERTPYAD